MSFCHNLNFNLKLRLFFLFQCIEEFSLQDEVTSSENSTAISV